MHDDTDRDENGVPADVLRSAPTAYWGLAMMAELAQQDGRVQRLWTESPVGRGEHDIVLERFPEWREMLFHIRDDYANRAFERTRTHIADVSDDNDDVPISLLLYYEQARRWLASIGLKGVAAFGEDSNEVFRVVHALRMVTTAAFAGRTNAEAQAIFTAAVDGARARIAADPRASSYPDARPVDGIRTDPRTWRGEPCIRGLGIPVYAVVSMLGEGMNYEQVLAEHPGMTVEHITAALRHAAYTVRHAP